MQILAPSERTVIFGLGDSLSKTHTFAYDSKYEYNKKSLLQKLLFCGMDGTRTRDPLRDRQVF